jgi:hypothetical protein
MPPVDEKRVDAKVLKRLYGDSVAATAILNDFASRTYNSTSTKVERLETRLRRAGHELARRDVVAVLKQLADAGCGSFITGRRGQSSRLEWSVQMISVAKAAKGEGAAVERLDPAEPNAPEEDDDVPAGLVKHPYRLRQDLTLSLELPANLTAKEALRLGEFIKTLPFDETADA